MHKELEDLIAIIKKNLGMDISVYDQTFLIRMLDKRKAEVGIDQTADFSIMLKNNLAENEAFLQSLSIHYTEFFREPLTYAFLEKVVLPGISRAKQGQELRIWSAGCSYGQEPYSLAMLLDNLCYANKKEIGYRIFATDLSEKALIIASSGKYHQDSVQNLKLNQLNRFFIKQENSYTIIPNLRKHIDFSFYDLLDRATCNPPESIYGDFDIVMCSNLLFYYNQECQKIIINKLLKTLAPGGLLITGEVEKACVENYINRKAMNINVPIFSRDKGYC